MRIESRFEGIISSWCVLEGLQSRTAQAKSEMLFRESPTDENKRRDLSRVRIKALCLSACLVSPVELAGIVHLEVLRSLVE